MIRAPTEFLLLAVLSFSGYIFYLRKRHESNDLRATYVFVSLWFAWTLFCLFNAPPAPGPSPVEFICPSPQDVFNTYMAFAMYPTLAVLLIVVVDLTIYLLKTR